MTRRARERSATIKDVAREADVSVASASRALNGFSNVAEPTRQRVIAAAARLRYVPHIGARSLIMRRTNMIGVVLPDMYGEFFSELIRGADVGAREHGMHLIVTSAHGDAKEAGEIVHAMRGRVDGMIMMSPHVNEDFTDRYLDHDLPLVLMNGRAARASHAAINIDNRGGAETMVRHLYATGHRRIALIGGPEGNFDAEERLRGCRAALRALKLEAAATLEGDFTEEAGRAAARKLLRAKRMPDAIFALNDMMAVGCMAALEDAGVAVPAHTSVAGFDDVPIAAYVRPGLTTMRVDIAGLGRQAVAQLLTSIRGDAKAAGEATTAPLELIVRGSTRTRTNKENREG